MTLASSQINRLDDPKLLFIERLELGLPAMMRSPLPTVGRRLLAHLAALVVVSEPIDQNLPVLVQLLALSVPSSADDFLLDLVVTHGVALLRNPGSAESLAKFADPALTLRA